MKILWLINMMLPQIAKKMNLPIPVVGGWLTGFSNSLLHIPEITLAVCFPDRNTSQIVKGNADNLIYYMYPQDNKNKCCLENERYYSYIIKDYSPDVIHIFGTEYPGILSMMNVSVPEKTIISITGMVSIYAIHYFGDIPLKYRRKELFKRLLSKIYSNIAIISAGMEDFTKRGIYEIDAIKKARYITGRTIWDYACVKQINSEVFYYHCNETLRDSFYINSWDIAKCKRHTIFVSQGGYPLKGLHKLFEAVFIVKRNYPDVHLYIGGSQLIKTRKYVEEKVIYFLNPYAKYLRELIDMYSLKENITFLGMLNEEKICNEYLKANVYVLPSNIENSPNSLGEAMILGVPCITSCVGGVQDMFIDREDGFMYPFDEPYMLAHYIEKIFGNDNLAIEFSNNSRKHALITHDREKNLNTLLSIYKTIVNKYERRTL